MLAVFEAYLSHPALDHDRGCAFLNGAAELPRDHPGFEVIRAHKQAVRAKIAELLEADYPGVVQSEMSSPEHLFLLLEGAVAQAAVEGTTDSVRRAEPIARALLRPLTPVADRPPPQPYANRPRPKLVIFDCDGVLVDSERLSSEVLAATICGVGVDCFLFRQGRFGRDAGRRLPA